MSTQELKEQIDALYETFSIEHSGKSKAALMVVLEKH